MAEDAVAGGGVARDIMETDPPSCGPDTALEELIERFGDENVTGMLVVDEDQRLLGVITESDLVESRKNIHLPTAIALFDMVIPMGEAQFEEELARMQAMTVEDLMQRDVVTVDVGATLDDVATIMSDRHVHHLPVLDGDAVVGMIRKHDVIRALMR